MSKKKSSFNLYRYLIFILAKSAYKNIIISEIIVAPSNKVKKSKILRYDPELVVLNLQQSYSRDKIADFVVVFINMNNFTIPSQGINKNKL